MLPSFVGSLLALASLVVAKKPNVVFILTDDQDSHMGAAEHMPYLQVKPVKVPKARFECSPGQNTV